MKTWCMKCGDSGTVRIWHPDTLSALRDGGYSMLFCAAACTCKKGNAVKLAYEAKHKGKILPRLGDAAWHCRVVIRSRDEHFVEGPHVGEMVPGGPHAGTWHYLRPDWDVADHGTKALQSFIANKPQNYVDSFDDWNAE